jgi:serine/threonine protein kinase
MNPSKGKSFGRPPPVSIGVTEDDKTSPGLAVLEQLTPMKLSPEWDENDPVNLNELTLMKGSLIGTGSQGRVHLAMRTDKGNMVALKEIDLTDLSTEQLEGVEREVILTSNLSHPNIVEYYGTKFDIEQNILTIVMEYVSGGSLLKVINRFGQLPEKLVLKFLRGIVSGLNHLHQKNIIHGDLKCSNILLATNGTCKLADFGSSVLLTSRANSPNGPTSLYGTPFWMAPETFRKEPVTPQADMWSLGAVILEMITGKTPFSHLSENPFSFIFFLSQLKDEKSLQLVEDSKQLSSQMTDLLQQLLRFNPSERLTSAQLLSVIAEA